MTEISIVSFKWRKSTTGYRLKSPVEYSFQHVNNLYRSIKRNTTLPFRFICVTDDPIGLDEGITYIPLWDKCKILGGCYNRLFIFSQEIEQFFGNRFLCIDLDCVITDNIDEILLREEDFVINKFLGKGGQNQIYNGGLILMTAGSRKEVWEKFDPIKSIEILNYKREIEKLVGSDQAWIQTCLGTQESLFTEQDGVYDFTFLPNSDLPTNAKIVFFPGKVDPSQKHLNIDWIDQHWK